MVAAREWAAMCLMAFLPGSGSSAPQLALITSPNARACDPPCCPPTEHTHVTEHKQPRARPAAGAAAGWPDPTPLLATGGCCIKVLALIQREQARLCVASVYAPSSPTSDEEGGTAAAGPPLLSSPLSVCSYCSCTPCALRLGACSLSTARTHWRTPHGAAPTWWWAHLGPPSSQPWRKPG